jgi:beta-N-acetylglucosaminidase
MKIIRKICFILLISSLVFSNIAGAEISEESVARDAVIFTASDEKIYLYSEPSKESEVITELPNEASISVLQDIEDQPFSLIVYTDDQTQDELEGYILSEYITFSEETDVTETNPIDENQEQLNTDEAAQKEETSEEPDLSVEAGEETETTGDDSSQEQSQEEPAEEELLPDETDEEPAPDQVEVEELEIESEETTKVEDQQQSEESQKKADMPLMRSFSTKSKTQEQSFSDVSGSLIYGIAMKSPTSIYKDQSVSSQKLKSYDQGTTLLYKSLNEDWNIALVYINGTPTTGYISKNDVENMPKSQSLLKGIAKLSSTPVYSSPSKNSHVLKSYDGGSVLLYKTFVTGWYEALVYVNGTARSGYISTQDVENMANDQILLKGVAKQNPTPIYSMASKSSNVLKSYNGGTVLLYKTFTANWYEALVYVNGTAKSGYISTQDVENIVNDQVLLKGVAKLNSTPIYSAASEGSSVLRSYNGGTVLMYKTLVDGWYEALVYIGGKARSGYIKDTDVENIFNKQELRDGYAALDHTPVYRDASKNSNILRTYNKNTKLIFKTFSPNWYECIVIIGGTPTTGYIHVNDIKDSGKEVVESTTDYGLTVDEMVDRQMGYNPQTDKYRNDPAYIYADYVDMDKQIVTEDRVNVRSTPSTATNDNIVSRLNTGDGVLVIGKQGNWVEVRITWKNAKRDDVEYYVDPSNFKFGSKEYYQFLKLSLPANLSVAEVNSKILKGKGILEGKAQAFLDAANKYQINEIYLISHALLETGNGKSELATGVNYKGVTVYNMYGYGAFDRCALSCGAETAYNEGWFSPEAAIIGGAKYISNNYIYREGFQQDTLYKMRWNPFEAHQYATDIGWAAKQVGNMYDLYNLLDSYTLYFDKPTYSMK